MDNNKCISFCGPSRGALVRQTAEVYRRILLQLGDLKDLAGSDKDATAAIENLRFLCRTFVAFNAGRGSHAASRLRALQEVRGGRKRESLQVLLLVADEAEALGFSQREYVHERRAARAPRGLRRIANAG